VIIIILKYVFVVLVVIEIILLSEANTWKDNLNNNVSIYFYPRGEYRESLKPKMESGARPFGVQRHLAH
jgi:hypothetical protein